MNDRQPAESPRCPMAVDPLSAIGLLKASVEANTEMTREVSEKLNVHTESHKRIDKHMADVSRVLFDRDGVCDQARDCKNFREGQAEAGHAWPIWVAAIGGVVGSLAALGTMATMFLHK